MNSESCDRAAFSSPTLGYWLTVIFFYVLGLSCGFDHSKEAVGVFMDIIAGYFSANLFVICWGLIGLVFWLAEVLLPRRLTLHEKRLSELVNVIVCARTILL